MIAYAVEHSQLEQACRVLTQDYDSPAMTIKSAILKTVTLIEIHHSGQKTQPKGRLVLDARLDRLGVDLIETLDIPHEETAIINAIAKATGDAIFFLTSSATSDSNDTAPAALRRAGGRSRGSACPLIPAISCFSDHLKTAP